LARGIKLGKRVEGAGVDVAGLETDDRGAGAGAQGFVEGLRVHAALVIGPDGENVAVAEPHQVDGGVDGGVAAFAADNVDVRRALQAVDVDVPAVLAEHGVAGDGQRGEVGHLRAGHQANAGFRRQAEQIEQPFGDDFFDEGGCGRGVVDLRILVPGGSQPVGGDADGGGAADDEAKVARTAAVDQAVFGAFDQGLDGEFGCFAFVRQVGVDQGEEFGMRGGDPDGQVGQFFAVSAGCLGQVDEQFCGHKIILVV